MRYMILLACLCLMGCSGTGLEKRATFVPDSVTVSYGQERFRGDPEAWQGATISATWEFK